MRIPPAIPIALLAVLSFATAAVGQAPGAGQLPRGDFAVRCGRLHLGDGRVLTDAWLVVQNGRIRSVGSEAPPADLPVLDASARVVMPGIVAADSDLAEARDEEYAVTPDFLAVDGFDFVQERRDALAGGVTTAYLSPGRQRLVSGQGAVVKLRGNDILRQVLRESACLRISMAEGATQAPRVFEPTPFPTSDDPLLPSRIQRPSASISLLSELRGLLAPPAADANGNGGLVGPGSAENQYDPAPLHAAARGELTLRTGAQRGQDIRRALQLAEELGVGRAMVLEDPWEIGPLAARAAALGVGATFRVPVTANAASPGGEDRRQDAPLPTLEAPARAAAAGLRIALAPPAGVPMRDTLWAVAHAVRGGLSAEAALRAVCADAARILGVHDRVGTLAPDKDADFAILTGEPFAVGTLVETTYVDGVPAFQRVAQSRLLAVRAGRVLTGEGRALGPATVLCQDGRIVAVGEGLSVPYGATVIDLPEGVVTPGFIDAFSHLGLAGDGTGVPPGAANQRLHEVVRHDDPMFGPALAAGITTVLVSGKDGGTQGGRVAAFKTGATDHAGMLLREIAGQRLQHDALGPDATKPIKDLLDRARRYVEAWQKYEQALADWKAGKGKKPVAAPPPVAAPAGGPDPVSGTWEAELNIQGRFQIKVVLELKLEGSKVTGQVRLSFGGRELAAQDVQDGTFSGGQLKLSFSGMGGTATLEATVANDTMTGQLTMGPMGGQDFTATRTAKAGGAPAPAATGSAPAGDPDQPRKPNVDESLEPLRSVLEKRAALVVRVGRAAAIRDLLALLEAEKVDGVLHGADGLLDDPTALGSQRPGVLLGPELVRDESDGSITNLPARMAALGLPLAFGSGECAGARNLPLHAAYAVRYGLGPDEALAALTASAARLFRLDDRVGTLQKGRDADFVVFSGSPFEPTSRVLLVVVNGAVALDRRDAAATAAEVRR